MQKLEHGRRYKAVISLGLFEQVADNDTVREHLETAGFVDVTVTGGGHTRWAEGMWAGEDAEVDLPSRVKYVEAE